MTLQVFSVEKLFFPLNPMKENSLKNESVKSVFIIFLTVSGIFCPIKRLNCLIYKY